MNVNRGCAGAVLLVVLACLPAAAQVPSREAAATSIVPALPPMDPPPGAAPTAGPAPVAAYAPDAWIYQQQPADCCGPIGRHGPIGTELYVRAGPSFVLAGGDLAHSLRTGWEVMGGGKSLFFVAGGERAWVVDLGLSYTHNNGYPNRELLFRNEQVTVRNLHRTAVSLALGHDWFLFGPGAVGSSFASNFRWGIDGGARWGTAHIDLNPVTDPDGYRRRHDVYGAAFTGIHFNWECPMGAWTFLAGMRGEWSYSFMDLLPGQNTGLHDINVLFNVGVRY